MTTPPSTTTETITHVNGKLIVTRQPAVGPHPHPSQNGKIVPFRGVTHVLLADETEAWICDGDGKTLCRFVGPSTQSVVAHRNGTHSRRAPKPATWYPEATLRALATEVVLAKRIGFKGWAVRVAEAMNERKIKTSQGGPWTASMVGHLYAKHGRLVKVRVPQARPLLRVEDPAVTRRLVHPNGSTPTEGTDDLQALRSFLLLVGPLAEALQRLVDKVETTIVDPELAEKARRFDELQRLMKS